MALQLKQAQRSKAYLKLGMSAPSGGGKTLGALIIAYGLMKAKYPKETDAFRWSKIAIIDTENGSGELYVDKEIEKAKIKIGKYNAVTLRPPFEADKYTQAIDLCQQSGMEVCIIDSTTHLWTGKGGLLEQQGNAAKRGGNSYTAWREITPQHNRFVETMLQTEMHIIATMRAKQEYVLEKDERGNTTVRKMGLEPEQRKGMEYEFTTFFEINNEHEAFGSKDRTSMFDQKTFVIDASVGTRLMNWLETGTTEEEPVVVATSHVADKEASLATIKSEVIALCKTLGGTKNKLLMAILSEKTPNGNPNSLNDETDIVELRDALLDLQSQMAVATPAVEETAEEK